MSQNSLVVADGTGAQVLAAINNGLDTLRTQFSGPTPPGTPLPYQVWADTTTGILKVRDGGNTIWIPIAPLSGLGYNVTKAVTGGTYTLSEFEAMAASFEFNGALTSNMVIVVPNNMPVFAVENLTTGAFTLTIKTAAGTGQVIMPGEISMLYCNGTNCEFINDTSGTAPQRPSLCGFRVSTLQGLTANIWNGIVLDGILVSQNAANFMSLNMATGVITVLQAGLYQISGDVSCVNPGAAPNSFNVALAVNNSVAHYLGSANFPNIASATAKALGVTTRYLAAGTTLALWAFPNVAMNANFWGSAWSASGCQLQVTYLG